MVAVVSPAGPVDPVKLDAGEAILAGWGLTVQEGPSTRLRTGYLAGSDEQRAADLNAAIRDPQVRAVWASRGGYGVTRILDAIDWAALAADPKLLVGFSDATALLAAAWRRAGLVTVHGQVVERLPLLDDVTAQWLRSLVMSADAPGLLPQVAIGGSALVPRTAVGGVAEGRLLGGNLTMLAALAGTRDELRAKGAIVVLEDTGEAPYSVDRLLTQLLAAGVLSKVAGVAVGEPVYSDPAAVTAVFVERLSGLGVPVVTGLPLGHISHQVAFVHGGLARLDGDAATLELLEAPAGTA